MKSNEPDARTQPIPLSDTQLAAEAQEQAEYDIQQQPLHTQQPIDRVVVQLRAEELVPAKQWIETGAVLVRKGVEVYPQTIPVEVLHEEVSIERVPMNRVLAQGEVAAPWQDGDTLVIPVVHEELVVTKQYVVREELRVTKMRVPSVQEIKGEVRRENITLDTEGNVRVLPEAGSNPTGA